MLINYVPGEECRISLVEDGRLEEFYQERESTGSHVGNIYKGVVTNVERSIQAAFVDFGLERNGFMHISDLHPMYFPGKDREEFEKVGSKTPRRERPPIEKCLKRGQQVMVQVLKEGINTKGPTLTSYLSIPGRFIVMMPFMQRLGVTRKIEDDDVRREMRDLLKELNPPENFGFIVRTAGVGQTKTDLKRDLAYLQRLWKNIEARKKKAGKTGELYSESDLIIRTIRDVYTGDTDRIVCDNLAAARRVRDFLSIASPRSKSKVVFYQDPVPLYTRFGIERQLESIYQREVPLPSGGSLVVDQTEALVAIDVNSGKSRAAKDAEENAYKTNLEAVDEICRQLRLRDLGGVVVNDFIDMRSIKHRKKIEAKMRDNLKNDRARTRVGSISQFGTLEMTRQRMRPSLKSSLYNVCTHCQGFGHVKNPESVLLTVMRRLATVLHRDDVSRIELMVSPDVAFHLLNEKRQDLVGLEIRHHKKVLVRVGGSSIDHLEVRAFDERGVQLDASPEVNRNKIAEPGETTFRELTDPSLPEEDETSSNAAWAISDEEIEAALEAEAAEKAAADAAADVLVEVDDDSDSEEDGEGRKKRRRRRRRGGRGRRKKAQADGEGGEEGESADGEAANAGEAKPDDDVPKDGEQADAEGEGGESATEGDSNEEGQGKRRRRRRRRRRSKRSGEGDNTAEGDSQAAESSDASSESEAAKDTPAEAPAEAPAKEAASEPAADAADDEAPKPRTKKKSVRKKSSKKKASRTKATADDKAEAASKDAAAPAEAAEASDKPADEKPKTTKKKKVVKKKGIRKKTSKKVVIEDAAASQGYSNRMKPADKSDAPPTTDGGAA